MFAAVHESENGTELTIRDVRCHGEYWGQSGLAAELVKMARLTHIGHLLT